MINLSASGCCVFATIDLITRDGRLSRDLSGSRSRKSRGLGQGPGLRAKGQSGPGQKSAGQSQYFNPAGQQILTSRDKNPGQSWDGPAVPGFYVTHIPFSYAVPGFNFLPFELLSRK